MLFRVSAHLNRKIVSVLNMYNAKTSQVNFPVIDSQSASALRFTAPNKSTDTLSKLWSVSVALCLHAWCEITRSTSRPLFSNKRALRYWRGQLSFCRNCWTMCIKKSPRARTRWGWRDSRRRRCWKCFNFSHILQAGARVHRLNVTLLDLMLMYSRTSEHPRPPPHAGNVHIRPHIACTQGCS